MDQSPECKIKIVKIIPSLNELYISNRQNQAPIKCLENGCSYVAPNASLLGWHKAKTHRTANTKEEGTEYHYHCPVTDCIYNPESLRYFKSLDIVRTHYMKLHIPKLFQCPKCDKSFGLERDFHRHEKECGEIFSCPDCGKNYSSKSSLIKHCDYNKHKKPDFNTKGKQTKETVLLVPKTKSANKAKVSVTGKKTQLFILPKPTMPVVLTTPPLKQHSLEIQTDSLAAQFYVTKMASECSVSQSVQTTSVSSTKSAGIQTLPDLYQDKKKSGRARKLSIAMQTMGSKRCEKPCAAQTQTGDSILQNAMMVASIPVVKLSKSTQKSAARKIRERKPRAKQAQPNLKARLKALSTNLSLTPHILNTGKDKELVDYMATMSTQTNLSCIPQDYFSQLAETKLQDCHTQTNAHNSMEHQSKNIQISNDQVTQTRLYDSSSDQVTQTSNILGFGPKTYFGLVPFQDNHTQTIQDLSNVEDFIDDQTPESISSLLTTPPPQNLSVSKEISNNLTAAVYINNNVPLMQLSAQENLEPVDSIDSNNKTQEDVHFISDDDHLKVLSPQDQNTIMSHLLRSVHLFEISDEGKQYNNAVCMETQTLESLAMDSMTQTIEDFVWDIGTQTVDDIVSDTMTQTGDDLLEYLTNDTQTQTFDDFFDKLTSLPDHLNGEMPKLTDDTFSPELSQGDNVSTQTMWDIDSQPIDLQGNSFAEPWRSPSSNSEDDALQLDDMFDTTVDLPSGSHMNFFKEIEHSETQTIFDPFFVMLEDLTDQEIKNRHYESSHTQTNFDPMLPAVGFESETIQYSPQNISVSVTKETCETQTAIDLDFSITRECQTPWEDFITMESSETQTHETDLTFSLLS